jgi:hypothetical protein
MTRSARTCSYGVSEMTSQYSQIVAQNSSISVVDQRQSAA